MRSLKLLLVCALCSLGSPASAERTATSPAEELAAWDRDSLERRIARIAADGNATGDDLVWLVSWGVATDTADDALETYRVFREQAGDADYATLDAIGATTLRIALLAPEPEVREQAIEAIERSELDRFVPSLVALLEHDPSDEVRDKGSHALRRIGGRDARVALRRALDHEDVQVQRHAADALARMNDNTARRFLRREARGTDLEQRLWAAGMLARLEDRTALPVLESLAGHESADVRVQAISHLEEYRDERAIPLIEPALDDPDPNVRFAAAAALGELGETSGVPVLRTAVESGTRPQKVRAMVLLGSLDDRESIPAFVTALDDKSEAIRQQAAKTLIALGDPAGKAYFEEQEEAFGSMGAFSGALLAGQRASDEEAEAPIDVQATDVEYTNRYARAAKLRELGEIGASQLGAIRTGLKDPHPVPRTAALWALAEAGSSLDVPAAIPLLADPERSVRLTAAGAILKLLDD